MAEPAFRGFVESTYDALLIFEGTKRGILPKIARRLQEFEKRAAVVSGAIFVFDEEETGIKRWTDGLTWSPSRTLGNFLIYRELDKKANPPKSSAGRGKGTSADEDEEDGDAGGPPPSRSGRNASNRLMGGLTSKADPVEEGGPAGDARPGSLSSRSRSLSEAAASLQLDRARERALVGSLTSSYRFRSDGLVKKTISLSGLHLIGYYRLDDVTSGRLRTPSTQAELACLQISSQFLTPSLFRIAPVVDVGPDGQLRFLSEADAPLSPITRATSSHGFPTPNLNQSRPSTSDAAFGSLLPTPGPSWGFDPIPGSPRRGATATFRSSNRFDPYSSSNRFSPSNPYPASPAYPFPLIPQGQQSLPRSPFPTIGETPLEAESAFQARTPPIDQLSTSAPAHEGWLGPQSGSASLYSSLPPSSRGGGYVSHDGSSRSSTVYQPRQAQPYAPTGDASSSNAIFAYNPPPPAQQGRYKPSGSPTMSYTPYGLDSYGPSPASYDSRSPYTAASTPYSSHLPSTVDPVHSPFATPPSTGQPQSHGTYAPVSSSRGLSAGGPGPQTALSHGSPALGLWHPSGQTITQPTTSLAQQAMSLMSDVSPHSPADPTGASGLQQQQQHASPAGYGYPSQHVSPYPSYPSATSSAPSPGPSPYAYASPHLHASGLVSSVASPADDIVPASGHGLGVSAYGEIVPASEAVASLSHSPSPLPLGGASGSSSYGAHLVSASGGLRQPPPPLPSVSLSSHNAYASPGHGHPGAPSLATTSRYGSPADSHLAGVLERDGRRGSVQGGGAGMDWPPRGIKRENEDGQQPISPPPHQRGFQPDVQQQQGLAPPLQQGHAQQQQGPPQWWGGSDKGFPHG
ncbi:hypothetical protein JCM10207_006980 [Rhodosporidiobolus poonsookiae]